METNYPHVLHQRVDLEFDFENDPIVHASTTLWLGYRDFVNSSSHVYLHCRQCVIQEILVNNVAVSYTHNDGLSCIDPPAANSALKSGANFSGSIAECHYRAALEIAKRGELQITVPSNLPVLQSPDIWPVSLPEKCRADVCSRFKKLVYGFRSLSGNASAESERPVRTRLLKVDIKYIIPYSTSCSGIDFRTATEYLQQTCEGKEKMFVQCLYTTQGKSGCMYDVDGIRCWCPCIDVAGQRSIFDINLTLPSHFTVMCSGHCVSVRPIPPGHALPVSQHALSDVESGTYNTYRYFTTTRIPACNVGFFAGIVERYSSPLYRTIGMYWVARGITDSITVADLTENGATEILDDFNPPSDSHVGDCEDNDAPQPIATKMNKKLLLKWAMRKRPRYEDAVKHTTMGLDIALKAIHKFINRRYDHQTYTQIFVPGLGEDFFAFDGFSLVDSRYLHSEEFVYQETACHMMQLRCYLYSWVKSSLPIDSYECEFIIHGVVGYLLDFYAEQLFGEDSAKYRFQKHLDAVLELEKMGRAIPLLSVYPERFEIFGLPFAQLLRSKTAVIFHLIEEKIGGNEYMRQVLHMLIKSPLIRSEFHASIISTKDLLTDLDSLPSLLAEGVRFNPMALSPTIGLDNYSDCMSSPSSMSPRWAVYDNSPVPVHSPHPYTQSPLSSGMQSPPYTYGMNSPSHGYGWQSPSQTYGMRSPSHAYGPQSPSYAYGSQSPFGYGQQSPVPHYGSQSPMRSNLHEPSSGGVARTGSSPSNATAQDIHSPYAAALQYGHQSPYSAALGQMYGQSSPLHHGAASPSHVPSALLQQQEEIESHSIGDGAASANRHQIKLARADNARDNARDKDKGAMSPNSLTTGMDFDPLSYILTCDAVSLDSFISMAKLNEEFLDAYVVNSGVSFIRFGLFLDEQRPFVSLVTEQYTVRNGKISTKEAPRGALQVRVAQVFQDYTTTPDVNIGPHIENKALKLHSAAGRKSKKKEIVEEIVPPDGTSRLHRDKKMNIIQEVREKGQPIRYAAVEPQCLGLSEVHVLSGDVQLVEQLFADIDKQDVLRQVQAVRSIARADAKELPIGAKAEQRDPSQKSSLRKPDKIGSLQRRALLSTLVSIHLKGNAKELVTSGHSPYVRMEAAFALANWQNERAPQNADESANRSSTSGSETESKWAGLYDLQDAIFDMFVDASTGLPLQVDLSQENSMQLRNAMLLALSNIKAINGVTPSSVVKTLLLFAENDVTEPKEVATSGELSDERQDTISKQTQLARQQDKPAAMIFNDSHIKAVILLALAKVQMESFSKSQKNDQVSRILSVANRLLASEEAFSKSHARTTSRSDSSHLTSADCYLQVTYEPVAPLGGAVIAASIVCLSSIDFQATLLSNKKLTMPMPGCYYSEKNNAMGPTGVGFVTGLNYLSFIAPPEHKFNYVIATDSKLDDRCKNQQMAAHAVRYMISPPTVRLAALEGFIRLCLVQCRIYGDKIEHEHTNRLLQEANRVSSSSSSSSVASASPPLPPVLMFVAALLEVVCYFLESPHNSMHTKAIAAQIVLDCIQDRPSGAMVYKTLSFNEPWLCLGFADPSALTLQGHVSTLLSFQRHSYSSQNKDMLRKSGIDISTREQILALWQIICSRCQYDQAVRGTLLMLWTFAFGHNTPKMLSMFSTHNDDIYSTALTKLLSSERIDQRDPTNCVQHVEMALRHGVKYHPQGKADLHSGPNANSLARASGPRINSIPSGGFASPQLAVPSPTSQGAGIAAASPRSNLKLTISLTQLSANTGKRPREE